MLKFNKSTSELIDGVNKIPLHHGSLQHGAAGLTAIMDRKFMILLCTNIMIVEISLNGVV